MKANDLETREKIMKCTLELVKSEKTIPKLRSGESYPPRA